jgi:hypothetical protein
VTVGELKSALSRFEDESQVVIFDEDLEEYKLIFTIEAGEEDDTQVVIYVG